MSLFNTLGQKVERFKQQVEDVARETRDCEACGASFHVDREECPECGHAVNASPEPPAEESADDDEAGADAVAASDDAAAGDDDTDDGSGATS